MTNNRMTGLQDMLRIGLNIIVIGLDKQFIHTAMNVTDKIRLTH